MDAFPHWDLFYLAARLEVTLNAVELIALDSNNPFATVSHGELLVKMEISTEIIRNYESSPEAGPGPRFYE